MSFHLAVEPFRDSVVPREAPHTDDGYKPLTERIGQATPYGMSRTRAGTNYEIVARTAQCKRMISSWRTIH